MVEQRTHTTRYIRAFGLFTLLAGIVAMHIAVFGMPHAGAGQAMSGMPGHAMSMTSTTADHDHSTMAAASDYGVALAPAPGRQAAAPACGDCGDGHPGLHGCVFILSALLLGLGLALLGWAGIRRDGPIAPKARRLRPYRARPPPWTHLSLAELAILRI